MSRAKKTVRRRSSAESPKSSKTAASRRRRPAPARAPAPEVEAFEQAVDVAVQPPAPEPPAEPVEHDPVVPLATPEIDFAARTPQAAPDRPHPARRRAIFFDVENTSRAEHIARVIEHLAVDRAATRTEFIAVGNWRVIGHDTARLLARHGAQLVHSAPSVGVRDWSDLRIAVGAGVWLAAARAGDVIELVSDDRAFDAVGDVASSLGITFRRLSFRRLAGMRAGEPSPEEAVPEAPRPSDARRDHGRRRGRRGGHGRRDDRDRSPRTPAPAPAPMAAPPLTQHMSPTGASVPDEAAAEPAMEPHTAPQDEIVGLIRELVARAADRSVSIDTLANALKSRGFRRPPGSPRLITRLRRIREITLDRAGRITLLEDHTNGPRPQTPEPTVTEAVAEPVARTVEPERDVEAEPGNRAAPRVEPEWEDDEDGPSPGNVRDGEPTHERTITGMNEIIKQGDRGGPPRRRSRRGGRGRWRGRSSAPTAS